jgi:transposase-like protein
MSNLSHFYDRIQQDQAAIRAVEEFYTSFTLPVAALSTQLSLPKNITEALCGTRVSPSTVSELNQKIHARIHAWRERPIAAEHP